MMIFLEIFICYFQIGLFSVGGGHASIPVIQSMVVDSRGWLTMSEFLDMVTISEMTPGPFALNSATFVGIKIGGLGGGALATFSCMLPSLLIIMLFAVLYKKYKAVSAVSGALSGIRPAVTALIASAGIGLILLSLFGTNSLSAVLSENFDVIALIVMLAAFVLLRIKKINPVLMILASGVAGAAVYAVADMMS